MGVNKGPCFCRSWIVESNKCNNQQFWEPPVVFFQWAGKTNRVSGPLTEWRETSRDTLPSRSYFAPVSVGSARILRTASPNPAVIFLPREVKMSCSSPTFRRHVAMDRERGVAL